MIDSSASNVLHIVNGDIVGDQLRTSSLGGRVLVWREIYTAGPLTAELEVRAEWLGERYGIPKQEYMDFADKQNRVYELALRNRLRIAIWVDPDLFDHAILMKLCHAAVSAADHNGAMLELVALPAGPYTDERLYECWQHHRRQLTATDIEALAAAWEAYAKLDFAAVERWIEASGASNPETASALSWHLKRQPGQDGLGLVERLTLSLLGERREQGLSKFKLFARVSERCPLLGMGDLQYWRIMDVLAACEPPLIRIESSEAVFLTETGRDVVAGKTRAPLPANEIIADNEPFA
ncbi:DUF1835 domain-containing protein [Cohnella panacarvi]|uniref:DUF1835 domain-containing protein n=1 Tax=Cohnella panacarvi TaxID=400776 RepID=UPI00047B8AFE|nr:DUF1835 domain-containing protein [Cohnella panacarvi]